MGEGHLLNQVSNDKPINSNKKIWGRIIWQVLAWLFSMYFHSTSFSQAHPVSIHQSRNKSKRREHTGCPRKILGCMQLAESVFPLPAKSQDKAGPGERRVRRQHGNKSRGGGQEIEGRRVFRLEEEGVPSVGRTREGSGWAVLECDPPCHTHTHMHTHTTRHLIKTPRHL